MQVTKEKCTSDLGHIFASDGIYNHSLVLLIDALDSDLDYDSKIVFMILGNIRMCNLKTVYHILVTKQDGCT